ncbi:MAG: 16S rRNA (cytidine(1402)-2'-O)-methyltransferase [Gammaproteobacteria bacterium]|nr:16S rRNA (cytidine(1402)-2'-O)-methyltransferase [Gammaproteobacteria bacterium]MDD9799872.1 16S rRNA (cytidine(1402)-2'-O)-methyltransferase [Gammaproteobacteria bacterium]MDD9871067.1 16S rRNA (cytidine(1402)-2'-O)-methyltransferase [Gammaproteobacteria bacterium]
MPRAPGKKNQRQDGCLFVAATPIGNLDDTTRRALTVLGGCAFIAAEDTRHTRKLLSRFGVTAKLIPLHNRNEAAATRAVVKLLQAGNDVALVSNAGTPLLSDPGYPLVRACHDLGLRVSPLPGASALTAALSVCGLPAVKFCFEGFLPPRRPARLRRLRELRAEARTMVFYEAPHRIAATAADLAAVFGGARRAALARELTKLHETVHCADLAALAAMLDGDAEQRKGESVLVVAGCDAPDAASGPGGAEVHDVYSELARHLPPKKAAQVAAKLTGGRANAIYRAAMARRG